MPIVADDSVDADFGTGCVKITPMTLMIMKWVGDTTREY